ncbi:MAG: ABC transporter permease [Geitlerinemataceae cyanobacterium]
MTTPQRPSPAPSRLHPLAQQALDRLRQLDIWSIGALTIALIVAAPMLFIGSNLFDAPSDSWDHLAETVLPRYVTNSVLLSIGVGLSTIAIGVSTAWLVSVCEFRQRRLWEALLLFPLAAPAYILAYTYTEFLDFSGPVQRLLRTMFGWEFGDYWFPDVRSLGGAIALLALTLYPYVYLLARVAFREQSVCALEASRVLGCSPWRSFWRVAVPLARPAIAAGTALVVMETLNDFGTVDYFGVDTFTTGIYRTWFAVGDRPAAIQLAAVLLVFVFVLLAIERFSRNQAAYFQTNDTGAASVSRYQLSGGRAAGAIAACALPVFFGFVLPAGVLLEMAVDNADQVFISDFWKFARNSLLVAGVAALVATIVATFLAYSVRLNPRWAIRLSARVASLGYAVPGSAIAVGVMIPAGTLDNAIDSWMRSTFGISTGLLFSGTMAILVFAYLVRFLAVSFNSVESSLGKVPPSLDEASRSLGYAPAKTLAEIHVPLVWSGLLTGAMAVFVDVMKELPATLALRPFNFDTLAVRVYNLASDERLAEASGLALALVAVGMVPALTLAWQISRSGRRV